MLFSSTTLKPAALLLAIRLAAAAPTEMEKAKRACYDETPDLYCYSGDNDIPQEVNVDDVEYIASYLRAFGKQTRLGRCKTAHILQFHESAEERQELTSFHLQCAPWQPKIPPTNTAAAYAKKIDMI